SFVDEVEQDVVAVGQHLRADAGGPGQDAATGEGVVAGAGADIVTEVALEGVRATSGIADLAAIDALLDVDVELLLLGIRRLSAVEEAGVGHLPAARSRAPPQSLAGEVGHNIEVHRATTMRSRKPPTMS